MLVPRHKKGEGHTTSAYLLLCIEEAGSHNKQNNRKKGAGHISYILAINKFCSIFMT